MLLSLQDIGISFSGNTILEHISGDVQEASRIGLIGANGAGKSTLLNMICGDLEMNGGRFPAEAGWLSVTCGRTAAFRAAAPSFRKCRSPLRHC